MTRLGAKDIFGVWAGSVMCWDEKFLYGTDSPLYFAPMQRARIDNAEISDEEKKIILRDNALKLLKLKY